MLVWLGVVPKCLQRHPVLGGRVEIALHVVVDAGTHHLQKGSNNANRKKRLIPLIRLLAAMPQIQDLPGDRHLWVSLHFN